MLTKLPQSITTIDEARKLLTDLYNNGESFHPEDDANDIVGDLFTKEEGDKLNDLMGQIYDLPGDFDPCEFYLILDNENSKA